MIASNYTDRRMSAKKVLLAAAEKTASVGKDVLVVGSGCSDRYLAVSCPTQTAEDFDHIIAMLKDAVTYVRKVKKQRYDN